MYPKLDYDIQTDFVPLVLMANVPQVLVVNPTNVPSDYQAFMAQVKAGPGRLHYGSAGAGTSHHLAGELFKLRSLTPAQFGGFVSAEVKRWDVVVKASGAKLD